MAAADIWLVTVTGMGAELITIEVAKNKDDFVATPINKFRRLVHDRWPHLSTGPDDLRILYAGKQLQDKLRGNDATFKDYGIHRGSSLQLVFRLPGGMEQSPENEYNIIVKDNSDDNPKPKFTQRVETPPLVEDKVHDLSDFSLRFTDKEPDAITGYSSPDDQPRVKMSCGHAIDANSLTAWCRSRLKEKQWKFYCPAIIGPGNKQCEKEWQYKEVCRLAHLDDKERLYFETKMSQYAAVQYYDCKECPGCCSLVERRDLTNLCVRCTICTNTKKKSFDFCWNCNKEWTGPSTSSVKCGRPDCYHPSYPAIRDAEMVTLKGKQVPQCRACPTCGYVIEHKLTGCKFILCPRCKKEFCFLCLLLKNACLKTAPGSYHCACKNEVASRQAQIPVWSRESK